MKPSRRAVSLLCLCECGWCYCTVPPLLLGKALLFACPCAFASASKHPPCHLHLHPTGMPFGSGRYPFPPNASIEGAYPGCSMADCNGDRHVLALDNYTCTLYEAWKCEAPSGPYSECKGGSQQRPQSTHFFKGHHLAGAGSDMCLCMRARRFAPQPGRSKREHPRSPPASSLIIAAEPWRCANGAAFNLSYPVLPQRPLGWTSADAAGLPIYAGLIKVCVGGRGAWVKQARTTKATPQILYCGSVAARRRLGSQSKRRANELRGGIRASPPRLRTYPGLRTRARCQHPCGTRVHRGLSTPPPRWTRSRPE